MAGRTTFAFTSSGATDFRAPLPVPGGDVAGAELVRELSPEVALPAWQALRSVLSWAAGEPGRRAALFDPVAMEAWEVELLQASWDPQLRLPLAVLVGALVCPEDACPERMAHTCLAVTDWALEQGAVATALAYAEAAAHAWPENPRYAYACGKLLRTHGRPREAERWIRHSIRVAERLDDVSTRALGLQTLGNTHADRGDYREAVRAHTRALRLNRKHGLEREGEILHDLFVATWYAGDTARAEEHARGAFEHYRHGHHRLPALAHDVAFSWLASGYHARALPVLQSLAPFFETSRDRVMVLGSAARAAGGCGNVPVFEAMADELWKLAAAGALRGVAAALAEMAAGATGIGRWEVAESALLRSVEIATERGEADVSVRAEALLTLVRERRSDALRRDRYEGRPLPRLDALADEFVAALQAQALAETGAV